MLGRVDVENLIQLLAGGATPDAGDTLVYDQDVGWRFGIPVTSSTLVNVKDAPFNAIGDGVVDDTAAIQAAMDFVADEGGGIVFFPRGLYLISDTLLQKSKTILMGSGWDSIIFLAAASNCNMLGLFDVDTEQTAIRDLKFDGNKANQGAGQWHGIFLDNTLGTFETADPQHRHENVYIKNVKGSCLAMAGYTRESRFDNCWYNSPDDYGVRFTAAGPTDVWFEFCTTENCGLSGFLVGAGWYLYGCKSFGSGQRQQTIAGHDEGDGFSIIQPGSYLVGCFAQENWGDGYFLFNATRDMLTGCAADSNRLSAFKLNNSDRCNIDGIVSDSPGLLYTHTYSLEYQATSEANRVRLVVEAGTPFATTLLDQNYSELTLDSIGVTINKWGTDGTDTNEHYRFGKLGSPGSGNPYYVFSTGSEAVAIAYFQGYDGTTTKRFLRADYNGNEVLLGDDGSIIIRLPRFTTAQLPSFGTEGRFVYDTTTNTVKFDNGAAWVELGGATTLDGLSDVVITSPATGAVLQYDGANWIDSVAISAGIITSGNLGYARLPSGNGLGDIGAVTTVQITRSFQIANFSVGSATPATTQAANADTSGATLGALETEVNELKAVLRTFGLIAT